MVCHGGFSLDDAKRRAWYNPDAILHDLGLRAGRVFIDVGCADGFFTLLAAKAVGATGIVYAVDRDAQAIERLKAKAEQQNLYNIRVKVGAAEETVFCTACADFVFYSMALHDFEDPLQVLRNAKKMLKPTGMLADLDWKKQRNASGPPFEIRFSEQEAVELMKTAGFMVVNVKDVGPYHYLVTAKSNER
ncbi:MAG: class I SAM-dependent methyltransferase [Candidatus Bathyarchaeota archaeon]|nr:class I SAM-dependent methyltransferase [Candidatus Bathyarchaeota archaeon]